MRSQCSRTAHSSRLIRTVPGRHTRCRAFTAQQLVQASRFNLRPYSKLFVFSTSGDRSRPLKRYTVTRLRRRLPLFITDREAGVPLVHQKPDVQTHHRTGITANATRTRRTLTLPIRDTRRCCRIETLLDPRRNRGKNRSPLYT